jgi:aspartyl/asparaginyl-tRNA synthetase
MDNIIATGLGKFSKEKFNALLNVRSSALIGLRSELTKESYTEVSTSSLVNIAGSCENPYASFTLNYYGHEAHLSQSAQLQLEALVIRLKRGVFTVNNSFREENYDDPEAKGRESKNSLTLL